MKKLLFIFLTCLFFTPIVNADVVFPFDDMGLSNSCSTNLFKQSFTNHTYVNNAFRISNSTDATYPVNDYFIELEQNIQYTISNNEDFMFYYHFFDANFNLIKSYTATRITFTPPENAVYLNIGAYTTFSRINTVKFQVEFGATATKYVEYEECSIEPEPDIPESPGDEPEKPTIIPDTTLDDFYSIYLNKLVSLSNFSTENKFMLSAIGIFILFIVLELVLNLFNKGGYR